MNIKAFRAKQHFDKIKMLGGLSLSKKSNKDFFDKLRPDGFENPSGLLTKQKERRGNNA